MVRFLFRFVSLSGNAMKAVYDFSNPELHQLDKCMSENSTSESVYATL